MDNLIYAYGHDEYLYQMLVVLTLRMSSIFVKCVVLQRANGCPFPDAALAMARYHSLYPWHTGGAYRQFMNAKDQEMLNW